MPGDAFYWQSFSHLQMLSDQWSMLATSREYFYFLKRLRKMWLLKNNNIDIDIHFWHICVFAFGALPSGKDSFLAKVRNCETLKSVSRHLNTSPLRTESDEGQCSSWGESLWAWTRPAPVFHPGPSWFCSENVVNSNSRAVCESAATRGQCAQTSAALWIPMFLHKLVIRT